MKRYRLTFFILILALAGSFLYLDQQGIVPAYIGGIQDSYSDIAEVILPEQDIPQQELTATPLRGPVAASPDALLSVSGILTWTNTHRSQAGLPLLSLNTQLNQSATIKVEDMFSKQYFAHESPNGDNVGELADAVGYAYILVGENLALGNYEDDQALVRAWMDSPGHRENILHDRFTEIGISVMQDTFEGHTVWMAVQEFGLPRSACPSPDETLIAHVDENQRELDILSEELEEQEEELEDTRPKAGPAYNRKVEAYNEQVAEYNALLEETKALVEEYNEQVRAFNACATA